MMIDKIEEHFILVDKCAGQIRIAEVKNRKLLKYICWHETTPPIIGNIYKANILKKLNGGVVKASIKIRTLLLSEEFLKISGQITKLMLL